MSSILFAKFFENFPQGERPLGEILGISPKKSHRMSEWEPTNSTPGNSRFWLSLFPIKHQINLHHIRELLTFLRQTQKPEKMTASNSPNPIPLQKCPSLHKSPEIDRTFEQPNWGHFGGNWAQPLAFLMSYSSVRPLGKAWERKREMSRRVDFSLRRSLAVHERHLITVHAHAMHWRRISIKTCPNDP